MIDEPIEQKLDDEGGHGDSGAVRESRLVVKGRIHTQVTRVVD